MFPFFDACHTTAVANAFLGDGALYMQYAEQLTHNHCVLWIGFFTNTVLTSTLVHCSGYARLCARSKLLKLALRMSTTHLPPYSHSLSIPSRGPHLLIIRKVARIPLLAVGSLSVLIVRQRITLWLVPSGWMSCSPLPLRLLLRRSLKSTPVAKYPIMMMSLRTRPIVSSDFICWQRRGQFVLALQPPETVYLNLMLTTDLKAVCSVFAWSLCFSENKMCANFGSEIIRNC